MAVGYWLPRGREKEKHPRLGRRARPRARPPRPPATGARGPSQLRCSRWTSKPPGQGRPRRQRPGTRAAASPPPGPAASLPPPPAWRTAAATARAAGGARNGAGLAASPRAGERGSPGARRPQARDPRNGLRDQPLARGAVPRGFLRPGSAVGQLAACSGRPTTTGEGGRKEENSRH